MVILVTGEWYFEGFLLEDAEGEGRGQALRVSGFLGALPLRVYVGGHPFGALDLGVSGDMSLGFILRNLLLLLLAH